MLHSAIIPAGKAFIWKYRYCCDSGQPLQFCQTLGFDVLLLTNFLLFVKRGVPGSC